MKKKYIDAYDLIRRLPETIPNIFCDCTQCTMLSVDDVIEVINEMKPAEVKEVVHAEWKPYGDVPYQCSNCGYFGNFKTRYCCICGALMEAEE